VLEHHFKRERICAVVRRKAAELPGKSLLELASSGEDAKVRSSSAEAMFDLRRVQLRESRLSSSRMIVSG